jgi:hypothetical protein
MPRTSPAPTLPAFLAGLPLDRRSHVKRIRTALRRSIPAGYEEVIVKNMLVYQVPFEVYSDTYNGHPLWYVALASEKSYLSLHLMPIYGSKELADRLVQAFRAIGKKPDMGKACIRFQSTDDLPLEVIEEIVAKFPVARWVEIAQAARRR